MQSKLFFCRVGLSVCLCFYLASHTYAQTYPEACTDPDNNGVGCFCSTAGILCTPDDLNGFEFLMSSVDNDGDFPSGFFNFDLCPGDPSQQGFPNNVNFFAFIVWCESLTFDVVVSNCAPGSGGGQNYGIQMAMFANCGSGNSGWDPVECITNGNETCYGSAAAVPALQTFSASGLEIGATYYFMVDGCSGSTCKIQILVQGVCGTGEINQWNNGLIGAQSVCVGDTETYIAEDINVGLDGAEEYYYYLDGVLIDDGEELYTTDVTWNTAGTYELCVDVSNLPCIEESDSPAQNCISIVVVDPGDGDIVANPAVLCPNEISTISVNNNNPESTLSQYIIIVGPDGTVVQIVEGLSTTQTYDLCGEFTAYYYSFLTAENPTLPMVGEVWTIPDCSAACCYTDEVDISFEDDVAPEFTDAPADVTIDCAEDIIEDEPVTWTDNCVGTGTVTPSSVVDNYTFCDGGTVMRTWSFTDSCSNNVEYSQLITIEAIPIPVFSFPPADSIIDCDMAQMYMPADLNFSNSATGACEITGSVSPTSVGSFDLCGSSVTYTWEYMDICGRTISYSQVVTVEEVGAANEFVNPPGDTTITCLEWLSFTPAILSYTNDLNGGCEISGAVAGSTSDVHDPCGSSITYNWEFTDVCNRTITHSQVVNVEPMEEANFVNPPGDITINCSQLQTFTPDVLSYTNAGTGSCLIQGMINATSNGTLDSCGNSVTFTWDFTDDCNRSITHSQVVTVEPIPEASFINPPGNVSINCNELQTFSPAVLFYTNGEMGNCLIEGMVNPTSDGILDTCGNSVTYTWEFTDNCNRTFSHSQIVTVDPIPEASFINPPGNISITCDELQTFAPAILTYSNGGTGNCQIEGTVDPVGDGTLDICGNSVTYSWEFTDNCGRQITHNQTVTVEPIPVAAFVNPPGNISIDCDALQTFTPDILLYTNGGTGNCLVEGSVDPVGDGTLDICGNSVTYTWEFTDLCGQFVSHAQIVTVEPIQEATFVNPPVDITINCDDLQTFVPETLNYTNGGAGNCLIADAVDPVGDGTLEICGSSVTYTWEFTDVCGRTITHNQTVTVEPITEAAFVNPPPDITINCDDLQTFVPETLNYTNGGTGNCLIADAVDPVGDGTLEICGSSVTYTWEFTDVCGRTITHNQIVTAEPVAEAAFVDPPDNLTLNCDELQAFMPEVLSFTNGGMGGCLIEGTVDPVGDGTLDICGNSVTYTWEYTDDCGRMLSHTQTVTVEPIPEATFLDLPGDVTFNCDDFQSFSPAILNYTNGGTGNCLIDGSVDPVGDGTLDICGNSVTYTWEFTDDCGRTQVHMQTVSVEPIAPPVFIDPPANETLSCEDKPNEGEGPDLSYSNGGSDDCETAGTVSPVEDYNITECGGSITYTWSYTDMCGNEITHVQTITVNPAPKAQFENLPPSSITIACSENSDMGPDLTVTNNANGDCLIEDIISPSKVGDADFCGGSFQYLWEFTDDCGRLTTFSQTVNVNPAAVATFDVIPMDIDIACNENADDPESLSYTNGEAGDCQIAGEVMGVRSGFIDYCGGELLDTWEFVDQCGRTIITQRNVNVAPAPPAVYINPPDDIAIECNNVNTIPTTLTYSNGEAGICSISGTSNAVISGSFDACGGQLIYTWSFVDACGRAITHSQNLTVEPSTDPILINAPDDITIQCDETYTGPQTLNYSNGFIGACEVSGVVVPTSSQVDNIITNTWELTLPCSGDFLIHTQVVTLSIVPNISVNPSTIFLCLGESYNLGDLIVNEANGTTISITYHDAFPPTSANEIGSVVSPTTDFLYVINAINEFGCEDFEVINIFIEAPPYAGEDNSTTVCSDGIPLNLFNYIPPFADFNGAWLDLDGIGANISNPNGATFNNVSPGNYNLYYVVYSTTVCDNDTMVLNIEVIDDVTFEITDVTCIGSNDFYEVYINSNGFTIQATQGNLINITGNEYVVTNIPINTGVFISAFEAISGCSATEFIDIPDCDCPEINPPTGNNISICIDDQPFVLSVIVPAGMSANWFYTQNSNVPFLEGSTAFTIQDSMAGTYSFYVETYDPATECVSNVKKKIDVEINNLPPVLDGLINLCDIGNDSQELVSLPSFNSLVNTNPGNSFSYFATLADAESNINQLAADLILNLGTTTLFVKVTNSAACSDIAELSLVLSDLPIADIDATGPLCIGQSTGSIAITAVDVDGIMMTSLDGNAFAAVEEYTNLTSGSYTVYVKDENDCLSTYDVIVPEGLEILFTIFSAECDDNGTNTDPTDDFYTITLFIQNNQNNIGTYNVIFDGSTQFTFNYGSNESFVIPADVGNNISIIIEDEGSMCNIQQTFGPLNPCSTDCEVSIDALDVVCNDNGTSTDPSDDFYTISINASAMNGSQNNTYNVFLDGILLYNFTYGENESFVVDANGNTLNLTCQDNQDIQCQTSTEIGPLQSCSGGCQIMLDVNEVVCSNNGTSTNQTDDFYTFTITGNIVNGTNLNQFELFVDGLSQGLFNYAEEVVFNIPADEETHLISISDDSNAGCDDAFTSNILFNCSTDCEILINSMEEICFDNGTPQNSGDDYYEITINVSSVNGASNGLFNLYLDGVFMDDYPYDQDNLITIPANNATHIFRIQDSEELACELIITTNTLISCSEGCLNQLVIQSQECFDNGTATNIDDDYYEFGLVGSLLNGSNNSSFDLLIDGVLDGSYSYDELINITLAADNDFHIFLIIDNDDPSCTFELQTENLVSCSTDCEIIANPFIYTCFDNNTPTDPSDDYLEIIVNATAINGATNNKYNLYLNGLLEGVFTYGTAVILTVPAMNQIVVLRFQDSQDLQCDLEVETDVLTPCSDGCLIDLNIVNIECFNNGTPTDVNDDYYEITVSGEVLNGMPSNSIDVYLDNVLQGSSTYGANFIVNVPADAATHVIDIADSNDPGCTATYTSDILTSCSTDCEINLSGLTFTCFDNGTLDDPGDDYYVVSFTADAINGSSGFRLTASGLQLGNFTYGELVELNFPADGTNLILLLTDLSDQQCKLNQVLGTLDSCSDQCTIEPMIMDAQCFDNGTPIDPSDDYWEITIFVNPANGETAPNYEVRVDGISYGLYPYSENIIITIAADNSTHQILVFDEVDMTCDAQVTTMSLGFCSTPCEITAIYNNVTCDNNGTNDTGDDDLYFVDLTVNNPSSGQYEISGQSINGSYNQTINIGPFNISDGPFALQVVDSDQSLCFIELELIPPPPCSECVQVVDAGIGGTISCEVTEINLVGSSAEAGQYFWYGPAGNLVSQQLEATAVSIGLYTFSVLFSDGCVAEDQVEIVADVDLPIAIGASNGAITCAKLTSELDGSASGSTADFFFYWYNEDGDLVSEEQVFVTDTPGVYFLQVESKVNNCKSALDAVIIDEMTEEPTAIIYAEPSNVIDCVIESIILSTEQEENVNYIWSFNGTTIDNVIELEISEIGTYGLLAIDTITGCSGDADLIISSLVDYPNIMLQAPDMLNCENEEVVIIASTLTTSNNLTSYWTDVDLNVLAENQNTLIVTQPGEYIYTLIDNENGCENTDTILIELFITEVEIITTPEVTYIDGESVTLSATVNIINSQIENIAWTPDENMSCPTCLITRINNPTDSVYVITVKDINGCIDSAQVRLIKKDRPEIYIPNVLNLGSTTGNDKFTIYANSEIESISKLKIYDRWGNLVYAIENQELNNPAVGWDGSFNGQNVEQGVYVYVLEALLVNGSLQSYFGDLTVLR